MNVGRARVALRRAAGAAAILIPLAAMPAPGFAQPQTQSQAQPQPQTQTQTQTQPQTQTAHSARLSADLADHLAAGSQSIDVIVHGDRAAVDALASRYNLLVARRLRSGGVLRVNAGQLDALRRDPDVDHLSGDIPLRPVMAITNAAIGADRLWTGSGGTPALTGRGVTVAVIDSGISERHSALRRRVVATADFTGGDGVDRYGHGTHVAAIIAGQAGRTVETRDVQGVAPGAYLINLRVLGDDGSGVISSVVEAIDWAIENKARYRIGVINLSLGAPVLQPYRDDPLCEAVERAVRAGIVVVAAAGNLGRGRGGQPVSGGIITPGNDPGALTVGAIDTRGTPDREDDVAAAYSSHGPTRYDLVSKPDVLAPGTRIVSAEAAGSVAAREHPDRHVSGAGANGYIQFSGTSMAAAVVSGAVALLLQDDPRLTPAGVKAVIQLTSSRVPAPETGAAGAGSLNVLAAASLVGSVPGSTLAGAAAPAPALDRFPIEAN
ncbi:MAG: S8 family serine peptidase [Acidobacteriota bacterium]